MKNIKIILLFICAMAVATTVSAQSSLMIEGAQMFSSFKFKDTEGTKLNKDYKGVFTGGYGIAYRYTADFGLIVKTGIGMRYGGANLVYDDMNYSWKLHYGDVKLGIGYTYKFNRVSPFFIASGYFGYLLRGTQILNNEEFNITESGLLSRMDYGVVFTPGVDFKLSDFVGVHLAFDYLWGLQNIEKDEGQKASNTAYGLIAGVTFSFVK